MSAQNHQRPSTLMSKSHSPKTNESLNLFRPTPTTKTASNPTQWTRSRKNNDKEEKQPSSSAVTVTVRPRIQHQQRTTTKVYSAKRIQQNQNPVKTGINLVQPIVITISADESEDNRIESTDMTNKVDIAKKSDQDNRGADLTSIMDNFIAVMNTTNSSPDRSFAGSNKTSPHNQEEMEKVLHNSKIEPSACVDFGIADYLCDFKSDDDEIDVDLSSDTDSNFIEAIPPHRFSDSDFEFEGIEPISITLETCFNPSNGTENTNDNLQSPQKWKTENIKLIPRRPFRRHISLPPSLFMSRFFENKIESPSSSPKKEVTFILKSAGLVKGRCAAEPFRLCRLESISSSDVECANIHHSFTKSNSTWSMSIDSNEGYELEDTLEHESAFTSEIEKQALIIRSIRRLVRQDTTVGNFAPPHFRNT